MARFCSSCGKELKETSIRFCEYCGVKISPEEKQVIPDSTEQATPIVETAQIKSESASRPSPSEKPCYSPKIIIAGIIGIGILIVVILFFTGMIPSSSSSHGEIDVAKTGTPQTDQHKLSAEKYLNLSPLPENTIIVGQILGPIPGRQVEFVFEGGPNSGIFKSWTAVLIGPNGNLLDSQEGKIKRNELISLQGENVGTHTGIIAATSYSGDTYKVLERKIPFRG